jgi:hypothetical protein
MGSDHLHTLAGLTEEELSRRWRKESEHYASAINAFVASGLQKGWNNVRAEDEPIDNRQPMAKAVMDAVRRANELDRLDDLRERFPPAHGPFIEMLKDNGQSLPVAILLDDGGLVVRIGAPYEKGYVVVIKENKVDSLPPDIISVGRSSDREYFAVAREAGVTVHQGWFGQVVRTVPWPTGVEGIPTGFNAKPIKGTPIVTRLIPFNGGGKVLLVSPDGIFVLSSNGAVRLLPTPEQLREHFEWLRQEYPADELRYDLSMEHGAISPDERLIGCGHQSSLHYVFDANTFQTVAEIGPESEYPHYAMFSADGKVIAFNSCHFYNGVTLGVPAELLPGLKTEPFSQDNRLIRLEKGSRAYAGVCRDDEFIIGDAGGYLRAFDLAGRFRWQHFIGSSIGDIDVSRNGRRLICTTYAGFVCVIDLDTGEADPYTIGTATHRERRRWLFWKKEPRPLIW